MLRAILKNRIIDDQTEIEDFLTVDFDAPELEALLKRGGYGAGGSDITSFIGVELLPEKPTQP